MKRLIVILSILAVAMAGCGGGGGGSATNGVQLTVPAGAAPSGVTPTATVKSAAELPTQPVGTAFITGAQVTPAGTVFSSSVTLTFTLATPVAAGANLRLFQYTGGSWLMIFPAIIPTISADRLTLTVQVDSFADGGYFAVLAI